MVFLKEANDFNEINHDETNTCDGNIDVNEEQRKEESCMNFIRKLTACPPDIELQSSEEFAGKHVYNKEGSELFLKFLRSLTLHFSIISKTNKFC